MRLKIILNTQGRLSAMQHGLAIQIMELQAKESLSRDDIFRLYNQILYFGQMDKANGNLRWSDDPAKKELSQKETNSLLENWHPMLRQLSPWDYIPELVTKTMLQEEDLFITEDEVVEALTLDGFPLTPTIFSQISRITESDSEEIYEQISNAKIIEDGHVSFKFPFVNITSSEEALTHWINDTDNQQYLAKHQKQLSLGLSDKFKPFRKDIRGVLIRSQNINQPQYRWIELNEKSYDMDRLLPRLLYLNEATFKKLVLYTHPIHYSEHHRDASIEEDRTIHSIMFNQYEFYERSIRI